MKVTAGEEYGLRCLIQLARGGSSGRGLTLTEIAEREGMPVPNTAKLLRRLRIAGIVNSVRGRAGGYALSRPAAEISLAEALVALDGPVFERRKCASYAGRERVCVRAKDCSVRSLWIAVEDLVRSALGKVTVADLVSTEDAARQRLEGAWEEEAALQTGGKGGRSSGGESGEHADRRTTSREQGRRGGTGRQRGVADEDL